MGATAVDLHWFAGFLEGEGYFYASPKRRGNIEVGARQVQRQPLDHCSALVGGTFHRRVGKGNWQDQWAWTVRGTRAVGVMMTLYALMSPRRQQQITKALGLWKTWGVANKHKSVRRGVDGSNGG